MASLADLTARDAATSDYILVQATSATTAYRSTVGRVVDLSTSTINSSAITPTSISTGAISCSSISSSGSITGSAVYNAVWNDLADCIEVPENTELEYGRCYCFDGETYHKSNKYLEMGIIGIHSDTAGMMLGIKSDKKCINVAVAGFVLAYVDRIYEPGTPLTCTVDGCLTRIRKSDKLEYPERIVATYWKPEDSKEWGTDSRKVQVNGRHWVKVR